MTQPKCARSSCRHPFARHRTAGGFCGHCPCPAYVAPRRYEQPDGTIVTSGPEVARSERKRRKFEVSIDDAARARLDEWAAEIFNGNRSAAVEALILQAKRPPRKTT